MGFRDPTPGDTADELVNFGATSITFNAVAGAVNHLAVPLQALEDYDVVEVILGNAGAGPSFRTGLGVSVTNLTRGTVSQIHTMPTPDLLGEGRQFYIPLTVIAGDQLQVNYRATSASAGTYSVGVYGHTQPIRPQPLRADLRLRPRGDFGASVPVAASLGTVIAAPIASASILIASLVLHGGINSSVGNFSYVQATCNLAGAVVALGEADGGASSVTSPVSIGPDGLLLDPGTGLSYAGALSVAQQRAPAAFVTYDLVF